MRRQRGFTLIELLIYLGLMTIVVGVFAAIVITLLRIQSQQSSARQVATELNFVINTITRDVRDSQGLTVTTTTLTIATAATSTNPIIYTTSANGVTKKEGSQATSTLTTNRVSATGLTFTNIQSGSSQAVQMSLTLSASTSNPTEVYSQTLQTTAAPLLKGN